MEKSKIRELLKLKDNTLYHREGQELEFKEQFNLAGLAEYFRDFAAFSNNRGGYIIFGVKNTPRLPVGLRKSSINQFEKIDPERITGFLLEIFSSDIRWEQTTLEIQEKIFGVFYIYESLKKPVIAKKDEGKEQIIKNGEVYYRYGGRTQKIQSAELENIINKRLEQLNSQWMNLVKKIGKAGPENAAILDSEKGIIEKSESQVLVLDEQLAQKLKFIKEGEFVEKEGSTTLKLVGDVVPIESVEIIKKVKENLYKQYPYSAMELAKEIKKTIPHILQNKIWEAIKENDVKNNPNYSTYIFRNKKQEDDYNNSGVLQKVVPSIYNNKAIDFLVNILKSNK